MCARVSLRVLEREDMCMRVRACSLTYPTCNFYAPYYDVICCPSGSTIFFDIISQTARFWTNVIEGKRCVLIFSTTFVYNISHSKKICSEVLSKIWKRLHVKYPLFLSDFNETCILLTDFRKKEHISRFIKIRPTGAELFHADGRT
jgi:hypothetical protein